MSNNLTPMKTIITTEGKIVISAETSLESLALKEIYNKWECPEDVSDSIIVECECTNDISGSLVNFNIEQINTGPFRSDIDIGDLAKLARNQDKLLKAIKAISNKPTKP